jgi:GT2 family glycosyltransferase
MFYDKPEKLWFVGGEFLPVINKPFHVLYGKTDWGQIKDTQETKWVSGCCMLIKREVIEKIGVLDPDYFNNYEDVDYCLRAKKAGFEIAIVPNSKIYHKFAASMGGKYSPMYTYYRTRNNLLFFKKTGQWLPLFLNLMIFPLYSIFSSVRTMRLESVKATFKAIMDFIGGKYGKGNI